MSLNKEFLSEIISYLISKGVTVHDVLDVFHAQFEYHEQALKRPSNITWVDMKQPSVEESSTPCEKVDSNRDLCQKVFDTSKENPLPCRKLKSKSGQMLFDVINGKTVIEHLKENGISYTNFDNRIRKNWSVEKACTTPLTKVVKPYIRAKKSVEKAAPVIVPDSVKVVEESSPKTKMMLVNGRMTEMKVSDTDLVQSSIAPDSIICLEPDKIIGTKYNTVIFDNDIPAENTAENVTIEPQTKTDTDTRVNDTNANSDAKNSESERIEQLTDKTVRDIVTGKNKEKKKAEPKRDYTASDLCLKLGLTTHELREKIEMGELPQPDCGNKWSAKLLKDKNIILFF